MRRQIEKLYPNWLKQLDHHLLLNNPVLWGSRLHVVAFFSAIYTSICVCLAFVAPASLSTLVEPDAFLIYGFWGSVLAALVWVRSASYFRVEKHIGQEQRKSSIKGQVYALIAAILLVAGPILGSWTYVQRVEPLSTLEQLVEDANLLNRGEHSLRNYQYGEQYSANHQYNVYGNLFSNHATYWKAGDVYKVVHSATEVQREEFIFTYAEIYTRYGGEQLAGNQKKFGTNREVNKRLGILGKVEKGSFDVQELNFYLATLLVLLYVLFTVKILYQLSRRHAFIAVLLGFAITTLTSVLGMIGVTGAYPLSKDLWYFMVWGICLALTLFSQDNELPPIFAKPLLALVAFSSPFMLFALADISREYLWSSLEGETVSLSYFTFSIAVSGSLILWNRYFEPRFIATGVAPKRK